MSSIRTAIVGVGNCAAELVQGIDWYRSRTTTETGLMSPKLGRYDVADIEFVAAFDVNTTKVGTDLSSAIFAPPNSARRFSPPNYLGVTVEASPPLDGLGASALDEIGVSAASRGMRPVVDTLRRSETEVLVSYLPVGAQEATEAYASACLEAGAAFVNCVPVFIASDLHWREAFLKRGVPVVGDDIKSQVGATIVHRQLVKLLSDRGVDLDQTYQLNVGGNMDFVNLMDGDRLESKRESKTKAVTSVANGGAGLDPEKIRIGPSDFVPWLGDRKVAFIRLEGEGFAGAPIEIELRMQVWDSSNSAGVVVDAIRAAKTALDRGQGGPVEAASSWLMKSPPKQYPDDVALAAFREWIGADV